MKKIVASVLAFLMTALLSVPAFAGAPALFPDDSGFITTGGDFMPFVYIAVGVGGVVLILAIILFFTGKKK